MPESTVGAQSGPGDVLAIGFGATVVMWAVGYLCRLPPAIAPSWLLLVLMLLVLFGGGIVAGRCTRRAWKGGLEVGLLSAVLNLMVLGSLLAGNEPNRVVPSALWWIPGSFLVAAVVGTIGAAIGAARLRHAPQQVNWTNALAWVLAGATLMLLVAGGLVTSKEAGLAVVDWPNSYGYNMFLYPLSRMTGGVYYEHAHRLFGALVGLTTIVLATYLLRTGERRWLKGFAWLALLTVVVQGVLGGLRVTGRFTLSTSPYQTAPSVTLAIVHGTLGQVFFGMVIVMAVVTSTAWKRQRRPTILRNAATDRALAPIVVALVVVQIVLGSVLRHVAHGLSIHIGLAVIVILAGMGAGVRAWGLYREQPLLQRVGQTLAVLIGIQGALGLGAYAVSEYTAGVQPRPAIDVIVTTAHQAMGAVVLAFAVMLMLWTRRLLLPPESAAARATVQRVPRG